MDIQPATVEQIAEFKMAAAQRYKELGVSPTDAEKLFNAQMAKIASELGADNQPAKNEKVEKVASAIAASLKRQRASK